MLLSEGSLALYCFSEEPGLDIHLVWIGNIGTEYGYGRHVYRGGSGIVGYY